MTFTLGFREIEFGVQGFGLQGFLGLWGAWSL